MRVFGSYPRLFAEDVNMSVETVVSIVESPGGGAAQSNFMEAVEWLRWWNADPAHQAFLKHEQAMRFFNGIRSRTSAWIQRIRYLREYAPDYLERLAQAEGRSFAFEAATARMAAEEAAVTHAARIAAANAAAEAAEGTLVAGVGTTVVVVVVPVVAMIAVQMALGLPYYQAREQARKRGYAWGFAKGFLTGLLQWELRFTISRFWDDAVDKNPFDEELPKIRANAHNQALIHGRVAGLAKNDVEKKDYLFGLRKLAHPSAAGWSPRSDDWLERERARLVQVSYVIDLAGAAQRHRIVNIE
jgi:hypothetical protein